MNLKKIANIGMGRKMPLDLERMINGGYQV
jgi:uncharacterized protein YbaA (DUF1428 family)